MDVRWAASWRGGDAGPLGPGTALIMVVGVKGHPEGRTSGRSCKQKARLFKGLSNRSHRERVAILSGVKVASGEDLGMSVQQREVRGNEFMNGQTLSTESR